MLWKKVSEEGPPPFDQLCVVKGTGKNEYGEWPEYALAYNECYRPHMNMTQKFRLPEDCQIMRGDRAAIYVGVPFEIEEWALLEGDE